MAKDGKSKRRSRGSVDAPLATVSEGVPPAAGWQRAIGRLTGARACYGKPVEAHGHVVIPVATLRTVGGLGYGNGVPAAGDDSAERSTGGGGGGFVDARPIGFIDIGPDGVSYQAIEVAAPGRRAGTVVLAALGIVAATRLLGGPLPRRMAPLRRRPSTAGPWPGRSLRR